MEGRFFCLLNIKEKLMTEHNGSNAESDQTSSKPTIPSQQWPKADSYSLHEGVELCCL